MKQSPRSSIALMIVIVALIAATMLAVLATARQSPEPLTGNWVVRTQNQNNDGTFRTTYLNLKQEGARINDHDEQLCFAGGYDHNFVLRTQTETFRKAATVYEPLTGRVMEVSTTQPGMQFYSGNFLDGSIAGKSGRVYIKHSGCCFETQHFPDSPNQPSFPSTLLTPGEEYRHTTSFKFSVT